MYKQVVCTCIGSWFTGADLHAGEMAAYSELDVVVVGAWMGLVCLVDAWANLKWKKISRTHVWVTVHVFRVLKEGVKVVKYT